VRRSTGVVHLAIAFAASLVGAGCEAHTPLATDGPLAISPDERALCMESWVSEMTVGDVVTNDGKDPIRIRRVALAGADGLELLDALLLPLPPRGGALVGSYASFPPDLSYSEPSAKTWEAGEDAEGAELPPTETKQIVVGLRVDSEAAIDGSFPSIDGLIIEYEDPSGQSYVAQTRYRVGVGCTADDWGDG